MASISLPTGSYALPEPRASVRRLVNCFSELSPVISQDDEKNKDTPVILRRAPGVVQWMDDGTGNPVRSMHVMNGILYAVVGIYLYQVASDGTFTILNPSTPIIGSGICRMSDNGSCLVIIIPGTTTGYTYSPNSNLTNYTMQVGNPTAPSTSYTGTMTVGVGGELQGFFSGSFGSLNSPTWGSQTIGALYYYIDNNTTSFGVGGFSSDPTVSYFQTLQVGSTTLSTFDPTLVYSYANGQASWTWNRALNLTNGQQVSITVTPLPTPVGGAVYGTLSNTWPYTSQTCQVTFNDGEIRNAFFTNNSTQVYWNTALAGDPTSITQIAFLSTFRLITDNTFVTFGALDCWFIDSFIVFLAINGKEFYNSDSTTVSFSGPLTFTGASEFPREFGTDPFVGGIIDHRQIILMGQLTSEVYIDAGNTVGSPFSSAPNNFMQIGCAAGFTVVQQNQTVFWLANDRTVRQMNGIEPIRISNHGIEAVLEQADLAGAFAFSYTVGGHFFYVLSLPAPDSARTLVYDCTTGEWHELSSRGLGWWRPYCSANCYGMWLLGDSQSGQIGYVDTQVFTEYGDVRQASWIHQSIYSGHNRIRHKRLEIIMGTGAAALGESPSLTMQISDDGGNTWRTMPLRSLGITGNYLDRVVWWRLGMARDRVYQFNLSDPVESWVTDVQLEMEPGLH